MYGILAMSLLLDEKAERQSWKLNVTGGVLS